MARAAETYRGARRNAWRNEGCPPWAGYKLTGSNWKLQFDPKDIKQRPYVNPSWDWRRGNAAERSKAKAAFITYRSEKGLRISLANMIKRVLYGG